MRLTPKLSRVYICIQWGVKFWGFEVIWRGEGFRHLNPKIGIQWGIRIRPHWLIFFSNSRFFSKVIQKN